MNLKVLQRRNLIFNLVALPTYVWYWLPARPRSHRLKQSPERQSVGPAVAPPALVLDLLRRVVRIEGRDGRWLAESLIVIVVGRFGGRRRGVAFTVRHWVWQYCVHRSASAGIGGSVGVAIGGALVMW